MKWWQKKVRGWVVPFWYSDTPLFSKRARDYGFDKLAVIVFLMKSLINYPARPSHKPRSTDIH